MLFNFIQNNPEGDTGESGDNEVRNEPVSDQSAVEITVSQLHYQIQSWANSAGSPNEIKPTNSLDDSSPTALMKSHRDVVSNRPEKVNHNVRTFNETQIKYILVSQLLHSDFVKDNERIKNILDSTSDLISGVYEGGFKIWECTFDMIKYLERNRDKIILDKCSVLDLGCGSGLLGLYALSRGALVDFQDYNSEVLNYLTIPNTTLNCTDEQLLKCRYFGGDWTAFQQLLEKRQSTDKYDFILSSETIYSIQNLPKLLNLVKYCLKPGGSLYIAAKTCYFGVGGGTRAFSNLLSTQGSTMKSEVVEVFRDGIQREILHVTFT